MHACQMYRIQKYLEQKLEGTEKEPKRKLEYLPVFLDVNPALGSIQPEQTNTSFLSMAHLEDQDQGFESVVRSRSMNLPSLELRHREP